jgi:hypothetical protein
MQANSKLFNKANRAFAQSNPESQKREYIYIDSGRVMQCFERLIICTRLKNILRHLIDSTAITQ